MLCESCGYDVSGTAPDRMCPECGVAVAASEPERRDLTRLRMGFWRLVWAMLGSPRLSARSAAIGDAKIAWFGVVSRLAAAMIVSVAAVVPMPFYTDVTPVLLVVILPFVAADVFLVISALTAIESVGIRFFGKQRGWRITREVAWTVCDLASVGWLTGACVCGAGLLLLHVGVMQEMRLIDTPHMPVFGMIGAMTMLVGLSIGLLQFELLVYLGVRQCRFANPPRVRRYDALGGPSESAGIQRADREPRGAS